MSEVEMTIEEWAKDFKSYVNALYMQGDDYDGIMEYIDDALALLKEQPEIVRCRDCKWRGRCEGYDLIYDDDGFCSNGERRTDDA